MLLFFKNAMKKIILNVLMMMLFSQADAQVTVGVQGGIGLSRLNYKMFSKVDGDHSSFERKDEYITVPVLTAIVDIPLNQTFSIRSGLGFRQQGYSYINYQAEPYGIVYRKGSYFVSTVTARLNYLEVPLNVSIKLPFNKKRFEVLTGITFAKCLGGNANTSVYTYNTGDEWSSFDPPLETTWEREASVIPGKKYNNNYDGNIYVNSFNCNLNLGLGYKISKHFIVNASLNYGLTNMSPYIQVEPSYGMIFGISAQTEKYRETYINSLSYSFTVAYMFDPFGKKDE